MIGRRHSAIFNFTPPEKVMTTLFPSLRVGENHGTAHPNSYTETLSPWGKAIERLVIIKEFNEIGGRFWL